jgi:hypothetical protein
MAEFCIKWGHTPWLYVRMRRAIPCMGRRSPTSLLACRRRCIICPNPMLHIRGWNPCSLPPSRQLVLVPVIHDGEVVMTFAQRGVGVLKTLANMNLTLMQDIEFSQQYLKVSSLLVRWVCSEVQVHYPELTITAIEHVKQPDILCCTHCLTETCSNVQMEPKCEFDMAATNMMSFLVNLPKS